MLRIDEMYAFIADEGDGEGLVACQVGNTMMPLVAADASRVDSLRRWAEDVSNLTGRKITLVRFSQREELEVILPDVEP